MYIPRALGERAHFAARNFPALLVTGPRQAGMTTFLRKEFPGAAYRTLDDPAVRAYAQEDPQSFLDQWRDESVILDEIQYAPALFSHIKMRIDQNRHRCGARLMTGSQQFAMMRDVSDSLAGRVAVLELLPFIWANCPKGPSTSKRASGGADIRNSWSIRRSGRCGSRHTSRPIWSGTSGSCPPYKTCACSRFFWDWWPPGTARN